MSKEETLTTTNKTIHFKNGDKKTITQSQLNDLAEVIFEGKKFIISMKDKDIEYIIIADQVSHIV